MSSDTLPSTEIAFTFPAERLYHLDGTPREGRRPPVLLPPQPRAADEATAAAVLQAH